MRVEPTRMYSVQKYIATSTKVKHHKTRLNKVVKSALATTNGNWNLCRKNVLSMQVYDFILPVRYFTEITIFHSSLTVMSTLKYFTQAQR